MNIDKWLDTLHNNYGLNKEFYLELLPDALEDIENAISYYQLERISEERFKHMVKGTAITLYLEDVQKIIDDGADIKKLKACIEEYRSFFAFVV